jgi:prophage regulatory protein
MNQPQIELIVPQLNIPKIAQISHVEEMTGFHRSTLRRWWDEGKFPRPQKLNGSTLVWSTQTVIQWIEENTQRGADHE